MLDKFSEELAGAITKRLEHAAGRVGAISSCAAIFAFGTGSALFSTATGGAISLATFGLCGVLESLHVQRNAELQKRRKSGNINAIVWGIGTKYTNWKPLVLNELSHCGFKFNVIGFDKMPFPVGISNPRCPTCHHAICFEDAKVFFPGRIKITLRCSCGFSVTSTKTIAELKAEAADLAGLPQD